MSDLQGVTVRDFTRYYQRCAEQIHTLVDPLTDEQIWTRPYPYGNSIGHLLLHLTGNLSYYIGAEIGGSGYVRNRPLEFSDATRHPKTALLKNFDSVIATVMAVLHQQGESDWDAPFAGKGMEFAQNRFFAFLHCAAHMSHHTGQMVYLCKEMERQAAQK